VSDSPAMAYFLPVWMSDTMSARARRPHHRIPSDIRRLLSEKSLLSAYRARPPYQRNDYIGWIERAKLPPTRQKRIDLMVLELAAGEGYMKMEWRPPRAAARKK